MSCLSLFLLNLAMRPPCLHVKNVPKSCRYSLCDVVLGIHALDMPRVISTASNLNVAMQAWFAQSDVKGQVARTLGFWILWSKYLDLHPHSV